MRAKTYASVLILCGSTAALAHLAPAGAPVLLQNRTHAEERALPNAAAPVGNSITDPLANTAQPATGNGAIGNDGDDEPPK